MVDHKGEILGDLGIADVWSVRVGVNVSGGMFLVPASGTWSASLTATGTRAVFTTNAVTCTSVTPSGTTRAIGMATQDTASGTDNYVGVLRKGTVILPANAAVAAAGTVQHGAAAAASNACIASTATTGNEIGIAYSTAASGGHAVVGLNL